MRQVGTVVEVVCWWLLCMLIWQATLTTAARAEWIVAAVLAVPCAVAAHAARRAVRGRWRLPARTPMWALLTVPAVVRDSAAALAVAVRRRRPVGRFTDVDAPATGPESRRAGWEAVATVLLSSTPGSLVVSTDPQAGGLRLHTLPVGDTGLQRAVRDAGRRR
ncbi:Na+/H+ antiporter subunit E [Nocardia vermiculata]|uniref:Uncharacterized protein n=1 Tax=Nocardia vermiculata TaxID=257274 RepID=A0A846Y5Y3_9NOCA|nr:Na+/H+ antiporter subunit E [Nocardia vermiculata]NKY52698.1 hypothetical protein [Nocardia vermiculata]